jgi:hypothetical protein
MSDQEGPLGGSGGNDEDLTLPKATVNKYVAGRMLPGLCQATGLCDSLFYRSSRSQYLCIQGISPAHSRLLYRCATTLCRVSLTNC